jgi:hypothetical protein
MNKILSIIATLLLSSSAFAVNPDPECLDTSLRYDPVVHGVYDATTRVKFCTPWTGKDVDTGEEIALDENVFELTACNLTATGTTVSLTTAPFPGFGKVVNLSVPGQFVREFGVELVCFLGRKDGAPIDPETGATTLRGEAATVAAMRFQFATLPAGILLLPQ